MEERARGNVRFDGVITAGNLLSLIGMVGAVLTSVFYVAIEIGHEEEQITAEARIRDKSIENLQQQMVAERSDEAERFAAIGRRIDESVDAERAVIAQINASLGQINTRLDTAIMGARMHAPEPSRP